VVKEKVIVIIFSLKQVDELLWNVQNFNSEKNGDYFIQMEKTFKKDEFIGRIDDKLF
jgi:hypothetical protein